MATLFDKPKKLVRIPGKGIARFPIDMPNEDIQAAIKRNFFPPEAERPRGFREALAFPQESAVVRGIQLMKGTDPATREAERTRTMGIPEVRALDAEIAAVEEAEGPDSPKIDALFEERERILRAAEPPEPRELTAEGIAEVGGQLVDAVKEDPGAVAGEVVNALRADPVLLVTPLGLGAGAIKSTKAAIAAGAAVEAGLAGGASATLQEAEEGAIDPNQVILEGTVGGVLSGALIGGARGLARGNRQAANAKLQEDAADSPATMPVDPELDTTPRDMNGSVKVGARQGEDLETALAVAYEDLGMRQDVRTGSTQNALESVSGGVREGVQATRELSGEMLENVRKARDALRATTEEAIRAREAISGDVPRARQLDIRALETGPRPSRTARELTRETFDTVQQLKAQTRGLVDDLTPLDTPTARAMRNNTPTVRESRTRVDGETLGRMQRQSGNIDPRLLAASGIVSAMAIGALVNEENPIEGGLTGLGIAFGALLGAKGIRAMRAGTPDLVRDARGRRVTRVEAKTAEELDTLDGQLKLTNLASRRAEADIRRLIPDAEQRELVTRYLDDPDKFPILDPELRRSADFIRKFMDDMWTQANEAGVIRSYLHNYVPHIWRQAKRQQQPEWVDTNFSAGRVSQKTPFARQRKYMTITEGLEAGLEPRTLDVAEILGHYSRSVATAIQTRKAIDMLKTLDDEAGRPLIQRAEKAPPDYVTIRSEALREGMMPLKVHPELASPMRLLIGTANPSVAMAAVNAMSFVTKRMLVSSSFFHAKALVESFIWASDWKQQLRALGLVSAGAALGAPIGPTGAVVGGVLGAVASTGVNPLRPFRTPRRPRGIERFAAAVEDRELARRLTQEVFQRSPYGKGYVQMLASGQRDLVEMAVRSGLGIGVIEDVGNKRFFNQLDNVVAAWDRTLPGWTNAPRVFRWLNHHLDALMWDRILNGSKLMVFSHELRKAIEKNARKHQRSNGRHPLIPPEQLGQDVARYVNDAFGNLDWRKLAEGVQSYQGRRIARAMNSPDMRRVSQVLLFAPDWTTANARILGKAYASFLGIPGTRIGTKSFKDPVANLYRMYLVRASMWFGLGSAAVSALYGGEPDPSKRKDPLRVDMGDGTQMQFAKQQAEFYKWFLKGDQRGGLEPSPFAFKKTLINKLGQVPKTALELAEGSKYVTVDTNTGRLVGPQMDSVPEWVAGKITPISAGQGLRSFATGDPADKALQRGVLGFMGLPVYGNLKGVR